MPEETLISKLQPLDDGVAIADDDRETMIKVDHVTMEFNMASEQLSSLKEYAIALAKRKLYFKKFTALDDISFEVKKGDVFGILGTNGSGKSTLLKIIAGVLEPTKGSCEINGNIAPLIELGAGFDMELSARENIYLNGSLLGYSKQFIEEHFDDIVDFAEIEKFLDMPMKNYSSGMIARIAFAIATVIVPEILIVDEVLSVGDFMFQQKCEDRINDLIENHDVTVLIVSHNNDQIERLCNKAIWIEKGHARIKSDAAQVCNTYSILGGRTGSQDSENVIYRTLDQPIDNIQLSNSTIYTGKDHFELASNAVLANWSARDCNSVFLVPDHTHVFDLSICGLAGALNAPILPFAYKEMPYIIKNTLQALKPSTIYVIADNDFLINPSNNLELSDLAEDIIFISCGIGCRGIRLATLQYGLKHDLWSSSTAVLSYHNDVIPSFAVSPYVYANSLPFVITDPNRTAIEDDVLNLINRIGIKRIISIGSISKSPIVDDLLLKGHEVERYNVSGIQCLSSYAFGLQSQSDRCVIASGDSAKMQTLLSIPSIAGKTNSELLLENTSNLDSVAECIKILHDHVSIKTFVGYHDIVGENVKLLNKTSALQ